MIKLKLLPEKLVRWNILVVLGFLLVNFIGHLSTYVRGHGRFMPFFELFNTYREQSIPTWYSAILLLGCAGLLAIIFLVKRQQADRYKYHWQVLSIIFLFLSVDEISQIHESTTVPTRDALGADGFFHFAWVIPASILLVFLAVLYFKFLLALPTKTRYLFITAAAVFLSGAIFAEMIGGYYAATFSPDRPWENTTYSRITLLEEYLELLGITLFFYALLAYMRDSFQALKFHFILVEEQQNINASISQTIEQELLSATMLKPTDSYNNSPSLSSKL